MKLIPSCHLHCSSYNRKVAKHNVVAPKLKHCVIGNTHQICKNDADKGRYLNPSKYCIEKGIEDNPVHHVKEHHFYDDIWRCPHLHFNQVKAHKPGKSGHKAFDKPRMLVGSSSPKPDYKLFPDCTKGNQKYYTYEFKISYTIVVYYEFIYKAVDIFTLIS